MGKKSAKKQRASVHVSRQKDIPAWVKGSRRTELAAILATNKDNPIRKEVIKVLLVERYGPSEKELANGKLQALINEFRAKYRAKVLVETAHVSDVVTTTALPNTSAADDDKLALAEIVAIVPAISSQILSTNNERDPSLPPCIKEEKTPAGTPVPVPIDKAVRNSRALLYAGLASALMLVPLAVATIINRSNATHVSSPLRDSGVDVLISPPRDASEVLGHPTETAAHPIDESVESLPVVYNWKFVSPLPPGYRRACIQGAVMSVLITNFGMPMNGLYTNVVAHRAEVALKSVRSADEHTREREDQIAVDYHPAEDYMMVAQLRRTGGRKIVIAVTCIRVSDGSKFLPVGYSEVDACHALLEQMPN